jgi:hypothetical protein
MHVIFFLIYGSHCSNICITFILQKKISTKKNSEEYDILFQQHQHNKKKVYNIITLIRAQYLYTFML